MFWSLDQQEDIGGDRSLNAVFAPRRYWELRDGLLEAVEDGGATVYCGRNWTVQPNETSSGTFQTRAGDCPRRSRGLEHQPIP